MADHEPEEPSRAYFQSNVALPLPEGLQQLERTYSRFIHNALGATGKEVHYCVAFHAEPRKDSFLIGFRVGVAEAGEIYIYVEPRGSFGSASSQRIDAEQPGFIAWQYPADPLLDTLASVVTSESLQVLFARLGLPWSPTSVEVISYRPGRRAMIRCSGENEVAYVKALRHDRVSAVLAATELAQRQKLPTARVIGWSPAGVVVFEALHGVELSRTGDHSIAPSTAIDIAFDASDRLARVPAEKPARRARLDHHSWYLDRATEAHPAEHSALNAIRATLRNAYSSSVARAPQTTIHGDFHLGQVFADQEKPNGLAGIIDIDGMGVGLVADDAATLLAHCLTSRRLAQSAGELEYWKSCADAIEGYLRVRSIALDRVYSSVAVQLVAHTLSGRGIDPQVAALLIADAAAISA